MPYHRILLIATLAIVLAGRRTCAADDLGPFGIGSCHVNNRSMQDNARWVPQMKDIGLQYYRTGQTSWSAVEPSQGQWKWDTLDEQLDYLSSQGFETGGILIGNPDWNTRDERGTLPVYNLPAWSLYVSTVVGHCKGKVKRWEVWNEPPNFTGKDQTPADYARIVVSAYRAAKAADPDCYVGLAAKSAHINYLEQVIKAGAKDHFDFITLHPYEVLDGVVDNRGTETLFMHIVPTVRKMLAAQNPVKCDVPIIFTELGCDVRKGADVQAHALIKAYTMSIAQGVACVHWFEGRDGDSGPMGLLDNQGKSRPAYDALKSMIRHLGQHPDYVGWVALNDRKIGFVFQGRETTVMVAWAQNAEQGEVHFESAVQLVDPLTNKAVQSD
ncbi:MAG: beta-galactosidase, partial [Planctomycetaceae bacterium]